MEIYQLRYFLAVAETGNFTKAAARSFVSQPSLSQQIINLEAELGQKLFHRLGRKISPTPAGLLLVERARRILVEVDNTLSELKDDPQTKHRVMVGAIPTIAPYLLPKVIARCRMSYRNLEIATYEDFWPYLVESVVEGETDLALVSLPIPDKRVVVETLFKEPLLLAVGLTHPLSQKKDITPRDLREESFIMLGTSSSVTAQIQRFCGDHDFTPKIAHKCAQVSTVKTLVALGLGVAILPAGTFAAADEQMLVYREFASGAVTREIALIHHPRRYQSRGTEQFISALRAALARSPIPLLTAPVGIAVGVAPRVDL